MFSMVKTPSQMHWMTGQFRERDREAVYRRTIKRRVRLESRLAIMLSAMIFGMFTLSDYFYVGLTREFYYLLTMRIVVVVSCLLLALAIGRLGCYSRRPWLHALPLWVLATGIILIVPLRPESLSTQLVAVIVAIMAFYLLIPNLLTVVAAASLYLSFGFLAAAVVFSDISVVVALRIGLLLVMANLVGFFALLRVELLQRKQFALLHEERGHNRRLLKEMAHRQSLEIQLRELAERDALTGLANRRHFMKRAQVMLHRARVEEAPFCLFMLDVDHFKTINDTWGHSQGDRVLIDIAEVCVASLRPSDLIGRFGGEEFVGVLPDTCLDDARAVAERLQRAVAALPPQDEGQTLALTVTIGIVEARPEDADLEALIKRADEALYVGKRQGRDRVVVCEESVSNCAGVLMSSPLSDPASPPPENLNSGS
ncbi:diguanylate cyclase [Halomonas sp. EF61]|uniref:diguanylate cyclase n=1 Tax=Halomonas sp. EF61 TaxID=2950869 RepID=UPI0032DEB4DA